MKSLHPRKNASLHNFGFGLQLRIQLVDSELAEFAPTGSMCGRYLPPWFNVWYLPPWFNVWYLPHGSMCGICATAHALPSSNVDAIPSLFFFFLFLFPFIVNIVVNHDNDNDDNDDASEWGGLVIFSVPTYLEGRGHDSIEVFYYNQYLLTGTVFKIVIL